MRRRVSVALSLAAAVLMCAGTGVLHAQEQATPRRSPPEQAEPAQPRSQAPPENTRRAVPREAPIARDAPEAQRRQAPPRREAPRRVEIQPRYRVVPRVYAFPPIDVRLGFYYHPYFGFYYGPYYGPYYPYPGPFFGAARYSASAIRTLVKPVETEVYINGYFAGLVDDFDGLFQRLYLPAGEHTVGLRLPGYQSFEQMIYVGPGDTFEIRHQMLRIRPGEMTAPPPDPRPVPDEWREPSVSTPNGEPSSPYGILAVQVDPGNAQIFVDGEAWPQVMGAGEFVIHLPEGWHQLDVRREGYQPFATKIELKEGQITRLRVSLTQ